MAAYSEREDIFPATPSISTESSNSLSSMCESGDECHGGDTKVNIKHADVVHINQLSAEDKSNEVLAESELVLSIKKSLKDRYGRTDACMVSLLSKDNKLNYPLQDYFLDLKVEETDLMGTFAKGNIIPFDKIFHSEGKYGLTRKQNILVSGDAGYGKTTQARKLCYDWATLEPPSYISNFDILVNIPLISIGDRTVEETIRKFLKINEKKFEIIISMKLQWLIILDGLDEATNPNLILSFLKDHKKLFEGFSENSTVIVTSRPYAIKDIITLFDRRLSILGLSVENQKKYIKAVFSPNDKQAEEMIRYVVKDTFLKEASECPMLLHMLCCVYGKECNTDSLTIASRTILYLKIFALLTTRYVNKYGETHITLFIKDSNIVDNSFFIKLGKIARDSLHSNNLITESALREEFTEKEEYNIVLRLGILLGVSNRVNMEVTMNYAFFHRTFAEFLEALYIVHLARRKESYEVLARVLSTSIEFGTSLFVAGLLGKEIVDNKPILAWLSQKRETLSELIEIKNEADLDIASWELLCSRVERIEYNHSLNEVSLLFSDYTLSNFREIEIRTQKVNGEFWACVSKILEGANSKTKFSIKLPVPVVHFKSRESRVEIRFINVERIMDKLLDAGNNLHRNQNLNVYIHPLNIICKTEGDHGETINRKLKWRKPVGLLASSFCSIPQCQQSTAGGVWGFDKFKIFYNQKLSTVKVEKTKRNFIIIPILVVTSLQYNTIRQEPFSNHDRLRAVDFKDTPMCRQTDDFLIPKQLGYVDTGIVIERLRQWRVPIYPIHKRNINHELVYSLEIAAPSQKEETCNIS